MCTYELIYLNKEVFLRKCLPNDDHSHLFRPSECANHIFYISSFHSHISIPFTLQNNFSPYDHIHSEFADFIHKLTFDYFIFSIHWDVTVHQSMVSYRPSHNNPDNYDSDFIFSSFIHN